MCGMGKRKKKGFMVHYVMVEAMALDRCAHIIIKNKKILCMTKCKNKSHVTEVHLQNLD
jgi:hypothetical protein